VNDALRRGEYFWTDIVRDGVSLYEIPGHPLATPQPMTALDASAQAESYGERISRSVDVWLELARVSLEHADDIEWRRKAAFNLHQAVEAAYACYLLVHTFYFPRSHNIKFLRSLAEDSDTRVVQAWPRDERADRRRFELLKRAIATSTTPRPRTWNGWLSAPACSETSSRIAARHGSVN